MTQLSRQIDYWIFDLDNTLYPAHSGIFQQVYVLMGEFISKNLNLDLKHAREIQRKYYKKHGTTLRGLMDNHGIDPDVFLEEVHKLDYSIVNPNHELSKNLGNLKGKKYIFTNANKQHADKVLERLKIANLFDGIYDIKMANYIPKPQIESYEKFIKTYKINPKKAIMFDDIAKNLVPASKVGFKTVWINVGYENFSDDIANSKKFLNYETAGLPNWLNSVNMNSI